MSVFNFGEAKTSHCNLLKSQHILSRFTSHHSYDNFTVSSELVGRNNKRWQLTGEEAERGSAGESANREICEEKYPVCDVFIGICDMCYDCPWRRLKKKTRRGDRTTQRTYFRLKHGNILFVSSLPETLFILFFFLTGI